MESIDRDYPNPALNVFLMMPFAETDLSKNIHGRVKEILAHYGLNLMRADDKAYHRSLWENLELYMNSCNMGIAVFYKTQKQYHNPNVSLELGYMLAKRSAVLLLKERTLSVLPTDIVSHLYRDFDGNRIASIEQPVS